MFKTISALNSLLGTLLALLIVAALGAGGWFAYDTYFADKWELENTEKELKETQQEVGRLSTQLASSRKEVETLNVDLAAKQKAIARLSMANRLLKVDHRIAQLDVLWQGPSPQTNELMTRVQFVETDGQGIPLERPRVFTIEGDIVHVAALVIKFADQYVEAGDPLRSTSVCLFQRLYGEKQEPGDGFSLDSARSRPACYERGEQMSDLEREIWSNFWEYANDPDRAKEAGVRAADGQSVYKKVLPGKRYKIFLRSTGDMTMQPEDLPANGAGGEAL